MEEIAIIRNKSELDGTCFIEIVPGKYQKKHWQEGSLFIHEETFGFIEPIFESHISGYDHYSMNDATKEEWQKIIEELEKLNELLNSSCEFELEFMLDTNGFISDSTRDRFKANYEESERSLFNMNEELMSWAKNVLKNNDHIAVLGI